jgi:hypothetical protein
MKKWKYRAYPNVECEEGEVEAETIEEAMEIANEEVLRNAYFYVTKEDMELIEDEEE